MKHFLSAIAAIALTTIPAHLVQAQPPCQQGKFVPPSRETRVYRNQRFGFSFNLPANYKTMALSGGRIDVLDPAAYEWTQCIIRNREATELKLSPVSVEVKSVNPGNRTLESIVRANYPWIDASFSSTKVANLSAVTTSYEENLWGEKVTDVYILSPNKRYLIRVSGPAQEPIRNLAVSSFNFK